MTSDAGSPSTTSVPFGRRLTDVADAWPDRPAIVFHPADGGPPSSSSFRQVEQHANAIARHLARHAAVGPGSLVVVGLADEPLAVVCWFAAWKLGACVLPIGDRLPARERAALLATAAGLGATTTIGRWGDGTLPDVDADLLLEGAAYDDGRPVPDAVADPAYALGSGGTSGRPKITVNDGPAAVAVDGRGQVVPEPLMAALGLRPGQVHLVCTPTYHANGFSTAYGSLLTGDTLVLFERFDAPRVVEAIERHRINQLLVVPAVLQRLLEVDDIDRRDLSSLESVACGGAPCPAWVARRWIDLVGAEHVYHGYGATERIGKTVLRGDEWLARPGSCGRPVGSEVRVLDEDGDPVPPGVVGEVYMRPLGSERPAFRYVGADYHAVTPDGFVSLGDDGWLDADGFLYIVDRRSDLIVTGGANVYPAEVERALAEHPGVSDCAVVGLPDDRWGRRVHAIVQRHGDGMAVDDPELDAWCRERLAAYKCPKTYEYVERLPRTPVGKISRTRLLEQRTPAAG